MSSAFFAWLIPAYNKSGLNCLLTMQRMTVQRHGMATSREKAALLFLARVPTRWNHLVEKNSRKFNGLSMILPQKWFPLLAIML